MSQICDTCSKQKASLQCGLCHVDICKSCTEFLPQDQFSFLAEIPDFLSHQAYCHGCFDSKIVPEIESYNQTMKQAHEILVYKKEQGKETRFIKRIEKPVQVTDCADHNEAILRLAFFAAKANYNAIIDVTLKTRAVKEGSYHHTLWTASAVPANVQSHMLMKDRSLWQNPN